MSIDVRRTAPMSGAPRREWMTVNAAAAYVGVHPKTLRKWYRAGKVPAYRLQGPSGPIRIDRNDLDALTARLRVPEPSA